MECKYEKQMEKVLWSNPGPREQMRAGKVGQEGALRSWRKEGNRHLLLTLVSSRLWTSDFSSVK